MKRRNKLLIIIILLFTSVLQAQYTDTDDFDGDGIINLYDLDDDNDGVPDIYEVKRLTTTIIPNPNSSNYVYTTPLSSTYNDPRFSSATSWAVPTANFNTNQYVGYMWSVAKKIISVSTKGQANGYDHWVTSYKLEVFDGSNWIPLNNTIYNGNFDTNTIATNILNTNTAYYGLRFRPQTWQTYLSMRFEILLEDGYVDIDDDNDGIPNRFDIDSDGDGATDAQESGIKLSYLKTSNIPAQVFAYGQGQGPYGANGLANALETNTESGYINPSIYVLNASLYEPNARTPNIIQGMGVAEICDDGIDNDLNGYVDKFDSACGFTVPTCSVPVDDIAGNFSIRSAYKTTKADLANAVTPVVADLDGDGMPEIIVAAADATGYFIYQGDGSNFTITNPPKISLPLTYSVWSPVYMPALADVDGDGKVEIIIVGRDDKLHVYNYNSSTNLITTKIASSDLPTGSAAYIYSDGTGPTSGSPKIADINEDGVPEVILGNAVFTFKNNYTTLNRVIAADNSLPSGAVIAHVWEKDVAVIDILPENPGKEIVAGGTIYGVNIATGTRTILKQLADTDFPINTDGAVSVADFNLDGKLDVVITRNTNNRYAYIWSPNTNTILKKIDTGYNGSMGPPVVANFYNDITNDGVAKDYPEVAFLVGTGSKIKAYNINNINSIWELSTTDASGATALTAFDFNGDGIQELIYRDQTTLRVFNGNAHSITLLNQYTAGSGTWAESPIVADCNNDGEAEILSVSNDAGDNTQQQKYGRLNIYKSGISSPKWVDAPNYWNERFYRYTNINSDLTVPIEEQPINVVIPNGGSAYPFNISNMQVSEQSLIPGFIAIPDISISNLTLQSTNPNTNTDVVCPDVYLNFDITNNGSAAYPSGLPVSVYMGDPTVATAATTSILVHQGTTTGTVAVGQTIPQYLNFTLPIGNSSGDLYVALNTNTTTITLPINTTIPADLTTTYDFKDSYKECNYTNNIAHISVDCQSFCYKPATTTGTSLETKHGITSLGRAGSQNGNWPMVRKGAWTALESKTKGFVINRIPTTAQVNTLPNPVEGMMVYDEQANCLKIYTTTNGTVFSWQCFNTQACPDN